MPKVALELPTHLSVGYEPGRYADVPLSCTGKLPTELEARGPKPNGLALGFSCKVASSAQQPEETFSFSAIRLDVPGGTDLLEATGKGVVFDVPETSQLYALNYNTVIHADEEIRIVGEDGDKGVLTLRMPSRAGETVAGTFQFTDADVGPLRRTSCVTRALP